MIEVLENRGPNAVYALRYPFGLDGRCSLYPEQVRGWTTCNLYLFVGADRSLLIDTGWGKDVEEVVRDVRSLLPVGSELELFPLRFSEVNSVCNIRALIEEFRVGTIWGSGAASLRAMEGRPARGEGLERTGLGGTVHPELRRLARTSDSIVLDSVRGWRLRTLLAPLRLLSTHWVYDDLSKTVFTSDSFMHVIYTEPFGAQDLDARRAEIGAVDVRNHLYGSRYWWVPRANLDEPARAIRALLQEHPVERIAPAFGGLIEGPDNVRRHVDWTVEALVA